MKVVICGDTHIGAVFGLGGSNKKGGNTRVDDYEKTLNYIVDYSINKKVDMFIQTGDAFETRNPAPEHMDIMSRAIKKLSMANITSVIIMGNHDYIRNSDGFTSAITTLAAKDYPNVRLLTEPDVIKFDNRTGGAANVVLLPYRDRRMYPGKTTKEDSEFYELGLKTLLSRCDDGIPTVAVGHNFFFTGSYGDYGGTEILANPEAFSGCDLVVMGHYHQFKRVRHTNPVAIYTGSMEKINFGDESIDKFFVEYDTTTKKAAAIKVPSRQLLDVSIDLTESDYTSVMNDIEKEIEKLDLKDKITRMKLIIKDRMLPFVRKSDIEKIMYASGSFYVSRVTIEAVFVRVVKDENILNQKDNFSILKAFVDSQDMPEDEKLDIMSEAKKIIT